MEDKSEDIDILTADESEETVQSHVFPYDPGFEDITDDDEDDLLPEVLSLYPLDQCSRTSPGNHSTIRRWKQRWLKSKISIDKHGCGMAASVSNHIKEIFSNSDMTPVRDTKSDMKMSTSKSDEKVLKINLKSDLSPSHDQRSQSAAGFSSLSVETSHNNGLNGPFSAPCSEGRWQQSTPDQTSTPVSHRKPRFPFHISSIIGTPTVNYGESISENGNPQEYSSFSMPTSVSSKPEDVLPSSTSPMPILPPNNILPITPLPYFPSDYFLHLQQQLLFLHYHQQLSKSQVESSDNLSFFNHPQTSNDNQFGPHKKNDRTMGFKEFEINQTNENNSGDYLTSPQETSISFIDSGLHISTESYNENNAGNDLENTNMEKDDCIIDVEGCDDDCEQDEIIADMEEEETSAQPAEQIEKMQKSKPINNDQDDSRKQNTMLDPDEDKYQHQYNPKKKMFENWSNFGVIGTNLKETTNINNFSGPAIINKSEEKYETLPEHLSENRNISNEEITDYKHKKIRRESKETEEASDYKDMKRDIKAESSKNMKKEKYNLNINQPKKYQKSINKLPAKIKTRSNKRNHPRKKPKCDKWETPQISRRQVQSFPRYLPDQIRSCTLSEVDLIDGLRILVKLGCHFYPGRLTEISPPDIYGIIIDKERGNKPHIFSKEEIINDAILETRPRSVSDLELGARVCAYWSSQMNYLHPGTVAGPDIDKDYVIIQLDDGDCRDIHIDQVRSLPENYPLVDSNADYVPNYSGSIKRVQSRVGEAQSSAAGKAEKAEVCKKKRFVKSKQETKKRKRSDWTVVVTEVVDSVEKSNSNAEYAISVHTNDNVDHTEEDQDSAFESDEYRDSSDTDDEGTNNKQPRHTHNSCKSAITAFLPPQYLLWSWFTEGQKLSSKSRKVHHNSIKKDDETLHVGDCAVFLSTGRPDRPYIGRIDSMWETTAGNMRVQVIWFYHPAEVKGTAVGGGRVEDIKREGALFSSSHYDENDVQTISHKCQVLRCEDFTHLSSSGKLDMESNDNYYLAGEYDPVEGTIVFQQGVFQ